ncbi:MAG: J domain-containing protein [Candidatus Omnitrophota bacterium]|nr:J domain-containing protein [Candidatus Omnitrophota bacterium]MDZ4241263.1 J domain-containing protein [Candidatus Omnitrophota bacterium]
MLRIHKDASYKEIASAFKSRALEFHPDRNPGATEEVRKLAEEHFKLINEAKDVLSNTTRRKQYDELREKEMIQSERSRILERIQAAVDSGNLHDAVAIARSLYETYPDDPDYQNLYADLIYDLGLKLSERGEVAEAARHLKLAESLTTDAKFKLRIKGDLELLASRSRPSKPAAPDKPGGFISALRGHFSSRTFGSPLSSGSFDPVWPFADAGLGTLIFWVPLGWCLVKIAVWIGLGIVLNLLMALGNSLTDFGTAFRWSSVTGDLVFCVGLIGHYGFLLSQRDTWHRLGRQGLLIIMVIATLGLLSMLGRLLGFLARPSGSPGTMTSSPPGRSQAPSRRAEKIPPEAGAVHHPKALKIIERAIEAHGGTENFSRFKAFHSKITGTMYLSGSNKIDYSMENDYQYPDRFKQSISYRGADGQEQTNTFILKGSDAVALHNGKVRPASPTEFGQLRISLRIENAARLRDLSRYTLAYWPPENAQGRLADGVRFKEQGEKESITIFFDQKTGKMAMVKFKAPTPQGREQWTKAIFNDYDVSDGIVYSKSIVSKVEGQVVDEQNVTEMKYFESLSEDVFAVPE